MKSKGKTGAGGKKLIKVPGDLFQAVVTNLSDGHSLRAVWGDYNERDGCESFVKDLNEDFAQPKLIPRMRWSWAGSTSLSDLTSGKEASEPDHASLAG